MTTPPPSSGSTFLDILDCLAQLSERQRGADAAEAGKGNAELAPRRGSRTTCAGSVQQVGGIPAGIATRLFDGLSEWESDFVKRRDHILRNMLFGTSITEMTGIISRRSLVIARLTPRGRTAWSGSATSGQICRSCRLEHDFNNQGKCRLCNAPQDLERGDSRENYAYSFIHDAYLAPPRRCPHEVRRDRRQSSFTKSRMGLRTSATPTHQHFVQRALELETSLRCHDHAVALVRGSARPDHYRRQMLRDRRIRIAGHSAWKPGQTPSRV